MYVTSASGVPHAVVDEEDPTMDVARPAGISVAEVLRHDDPDRWLHNGGLKGVKLRDQIVEILDHGLVLLAKAYVHDNLVLLGLHAGAKNLRADEALRRLEDEEGRVVLPIELRTRRGADPNLRVLLSLHASILSCR
jgi:hypothetical protein